MMTDRSGFCEGQPAAGLCHHPPALHERFGRGAVQVMAAQPREKAWAAERELLRWLMDAVPDAIYVKDTESRFVLANVGVARLLGADGPEELYGKTFC